MTDSDTKSITPEEIGFTANQDNARVLTPEANVQVVDEKAAHIKELERDEKRKKPEQNTLTTWKCNISPYSRGNCFLEGGVFYKLYKSATGFGIYEQVINVDVLII